MATKRSKPNGRTRKPTQPDLPGTEDRAIKPLEAAAAEYVDLRDQRMALAEEESASKARILALMKKHGKKIYRRDGITIELVLEAETVKVKVAKPETDDEAEGAEETELEADDEATA